MKRAARAHLAAAVLALSAIPAAAQSDDARLRVSIGAAATTGAGERDPAITASFGYTFSDRLSLDVDVMRTEPTGGLYGRAFSQSEFQAPLAMRFATNQFGSPTGGPTQSSPVPPTTFPGNGGAPRGVVGAGGPTMLTGVTGALVPGVIRRGFEGNTVVATVGVRYHLPVSGGRLRPYLAAGLGLARTDVEFEVDIRQFGQVASGLPGARGVFLPTMFPIPDGAGTRTGVAASGGFGASLRVFKEISLDVEARHFRFDHSHMTRVGGGVSYRF